MPIIEDKGSRIEVNEEGFMARPDEGSKEIAAILARAGEGIESLTVEHWSIVEFIRSHYIEKGQAPMVRKICQATGLPLKRIYELFPSGPAKGACMVAGLPKPDGCV
ncbi:MAG TPA: TusE/DsrC/DsvC family sulfur relay protein [Acidobacteriota bacterium]|nr:TusE/DsrC/DsvC family sulfur relay protein [Acidobacteriota bacterium]